MFTRRHFLHAGLGFGVMAMLPFTLSAAGSMDQGNFNAELVAPLSG
ncbi:hypothetical protein [Erwinia psidii]|nr:hypothetical protein [Erwinia psidii]